MTPQAALQQLLRELFDPNELLRWLRQYADTTEVADLVAPGAATEVVFAAVQALDRRGLVDVAFFDRLVQERPRKEAAIRAVQAQWAKAPAAKAPATEAPATEAPTRGAAGPAGPERTPTRGDERAHAARIDTLGETAEKVGKTAEKVGGTAKKVGAAAVAIATAAAGVLKAIGAFDDGDPPPEPPDVVVTPPDPGTAGDAEPDGGEAPETGSGAPPGGGPGGPPGPTRTCVDLDISGPLILPAKLPKVTAVYSDNSREPVRGDLSWTLDPAALGEIKPQEQAVFPKKSGAGTLTAALGDCTGSVSVSTAQPSVQLANGMLVGAKLNLPGHPSVSANGFDNLALSAVNLSWTSLSAAQCTVSGLTLSGVAEGTCTLRVRSSDGQINQEIPVSVNKLILPGNRIERIDLGTRVNLNPAAEHALQRNTPP